MSGRALTTLPLSMLLAAAAFGAFALAPTARAQEASAADAQSAEARKIDEYGRIGHCDLTARLDNFAIELQNNPTAKALIVGFDPKGKGQGRANWGLKVGRYYLTSVRGIDASRVQAVNGGSRDGDEVTTELWLVPEGAEPPLKPPADDRYAVKDFSGKFDTYSTEELIYREYIEMGFSGDEISHWEFAERLKKQPDSLGYLVVRTSKRSAPGTWRRVARREEQIIQKDYGIATGRLASVYGGQAEGESAEVELWILPKSAPPPKGVKEQTGGALREAVRLNRLNLYGSPDEDEQGWMLENIAEALRENPRAVVCIIPREPDNTAYVSGEEEVAAAGDSAAPEGEADKTAEKESDESEEASAKELAEEWKKSLVTKHGIYSWRVVVLEGKKMPWGTGRLTTWLVPENARWPDAQAPDEDEVEEEQVVVGETSAPAEPTQTPPR